MIGPQLLQCGPQFRSGPARLDPAAAPALRDIARRLGPPSDRARFSPGSRGASLDPSAITHEDVRKGPDAPGEA